VTRTARLAGAAFLSFPAVRGECAATHAKIRRCGEVTERLKVLAWKASIRSKAVSRVRIPPSPP
jgi:hypothetical protein